MRDFGTRGIHRLFLAVLVLLVANLALLAVLLGNSGEDAAVSMPVRISPFPVGAGASTLRSPKGTVRRVNPAVQAEAEATIVGLYAQGDPVSTHFAGILDPLVQRAMDRGQDPTGLFPPKADIDDAVASGSLGSPSSMKVLAELEATCDASGLAFPKSKLLPAQEANLTGSTYQEGAGQEDILRAFFAVTEERLERAAREKGMDPSTVLPEASAVDAAIQSADLASEATVQALATLRAGYLRVGIPFPEPRPAAASSGPVSSPHEKVPH